MIAAGAAAFIAGQPEIGVPLIGFGIGVALQTSGVLQNQRDLANWLDFAATVAPSLYGPGGFTLRAVLNAQLRNAIRQIYKEEGEKLIVKITLGSDARTAIERATREYLKASGISGAINEFRKIEQSIKGG